MSKIKSEVLSNFKQFNNVTVCNVETDTTLYVLRRRTRNGFLKFNEHSDVAIHWYDYWVVQLLILYSDNVVIVNDHDVKIQTSWSNAMMKIDAWAEIERHAQADYEEVI